MSRIIRFIAAIFIAAFLFFGCTPEAITPSSIRKAGVLKVGIKYDVPGFGYLNKETMQYEGMEIDIAKLIAKELLGDESKVRLIPISTATRGPLLDNGDVDLVIATFTITEQRKTMYNFSTPYYRDHIGIMVKKGSGIRTQKDLTNKTIGVVQLSPTKDELDAVLNVSFKQYRTAAAVKVALDAGEVDAFAIGCSILKGYTDDTTMIMPEKYSDQPLGVATALNNKSLARYVDGLINRWLKDGTIADLIDINHVLNRHGEEHGQLSGDGGE